MNIVNFKKLKKKPRGSIQTKIVTSALVLLITGFFIYYKMVDKSISEVNSKRSILQDKLLVIQEKLINEITTRNKEVLHLKRENLNLTNYALMEEKVFGVEASKKASASRLSTLVTNIFETFQVTMLEGNAPMAEKLIEAFGSGSEKDPLTRQAMQCCSCPATAECSQAPTAPCGEVDYTEDE